MLILHQEVLVSARRLRKHCFVVDAVVNIGSDGLVVGLADAVGVVFRITPEVILVISLIRNTPRHCAQNRKEMR